MAALIDNGIKFSSDTPRAVVARGAAFPGSMRPLCAYPRVATYNGKGNPEDSVNFTCREP